MDNSTLSLTIEEFDWLNQMLAGNAKNNQKEIILGVSTFNVVCTLIWMSEDVLHIGWKDMNEGPMTIER